MEDTDPGYMVQMVLIRFRGGRGKELTWVTGYLKRVGSIDQRKKIEKLIYTSKETVYATRAR